LVVGMTVGGNGGNMRLEKKSKKEVKRRKSPMNGTGEI